MGIYLAQPNSPILTHDYEVSYDGRILTVTHQDYTQQIEAHPGEAFMCNGLVPATKNKMARGSLIMFALGVPTKFWMGSLEKFNEFREVIIKSHRATITNTYQSKEYSYMTHNNGKGKEELIMAWVSNDITTQSQLNMVISKIKPFGSNVNCTLILV